MEKQGKIIKKKVGVWIDHKEAFIVSIEAGQPTTERIESNAENHLKLSGGWKAGGTSMAQSMSKEQKADERRKHQLHDFYQMIIKNIGNADSLFIFGPGEAKVEFVKEIEKIKSHQGKTITVEPSDNLTENQIVAKVKDFFKTS